MNKWIRSFILLLFALSTQWVQAQSVAKVGSTEYATLQEAINAVPQNGTNATTVTLLNDYTTNAIIQMGGRNVKLDLNGKTLSLTRGGRMKINKETLDYDTEGEYIVTGCFFVLGGSTLTVTGNGTITTSSSNPTIFNVGILVVENGTITRTAGSANVIVNNYNGQVTINGGTVDNNVDISATSIGHTFANSAGTASNGVMSHPNSKLTVNDGFIWARASKKNAIDNNAIVEINGGTITGGPVTEGTVPCAAINTHSAAATVTISGGNVFAGNDSEYSKCISESTGIITINPTSTFNRDISSLDGNGHVTINGEVINNNNGTWTVGKIVAVAKIGETKYSTLQAAVDAAKQMGGEVTINIIDDISGETVTIQEVSNFKLTIDGQKDASSNYTVDAKIIVDGLRGNGGGIDNGASVTLQNIAFVNEEAKDVVNPASYPHDLTIQDCTYSGSSASLDNWFLNVSDGPLYGATVKNVTVEHSRLIQGDFSSEVVFENIVATNDVTCGFNIKTNDSGGKIGTVLIKDCQVTTAKYALRDYKDGYNGTITLEGNTFISTTTGSDEGVIVNRGGVVGTTHINVVSGTYTGPVKVLNGKEGVLAISGGYFSEEFPQDYIAADLVAEGKACVPASDMEGYFTVGEPNYVAQIGNVKYLTLQDAIDAAEDGATIEILKDFELTTVTTTPNNKYNVNINKSVTIDGKGYTITSSQGKRALALTGEGNDITLKNLTVVNNKADWVMGILDNLTCTLDNTTIDGSNFAGSYNQPLTIGSIEGNGRVTLNVTNGSVIKTNDEGTAHYSIILWHPADVTVTDSKLIGWANIYIKPDAEGSTVTISGSEMVSKGISGTTNNFAIILAECGNNTITVTDTKITTTPAADTYQSLVSLSGSGNVVKFLGTTTYTTSDMNYGAATINWSSLKDNKLYFDDTTKEAFERYFDGSNNAVIDDETDETNLYPVNFSPEILYYWATDNGYQGGYYNFAQPFEEGWLDKGEFIALQKDVTLTKNIACQLTDGQSFNFLLGDFAVTKGDYSVSLNLGVTVNTDKQTDIFSSAEPDYKVVEETAEEGSDYNYVYSLVPKTYVAQIGDVQYETLADAVAAVPADGTETTIVMIDDETINSDAGVTIPAGKNVVLDLNGKTVTGVVQSAASAQTILNKGTLVVTDSSDEQNGTITNVVSDENAGSPGDGKNWFSNAITNNGTLTVNAGNIVNTGTGGACYAIDNITNGTLCTPVLNIAGGNISAKKVAVRMFCNSTTNDNTVNVTGGVITSEKAYALQTKMANNNANKAVLNISGGTLSGSYAFCDYGNKNVATQFDNASYNITGGFFSGYMWSYATYYCGMEGFVSGGYFDNVVGGDIVAPGKACVDNTEEETMEAYPYTIGLADVHYYWLNNSGQIDGGGYYTIYAPFAGPEPVLMDGEFVELNKDVTLVQDIEYLEECDFGDPIFKGGTFTLKFGEYDIDLNGHVFPIPTGVTILTDKQTDIFSALEEGYKVVEEATETGYAYTVVPKTYVAQIGDVQYETLADAVAAVPTDGTETTILMIADEAVVAGITIDATKNIVLELNGKTISGNTDSSKTYALITNKGTLTIQDNTDTAGDGTGTGLITTYIANPDGGDVPGYASNTITNNGNLTVKSGKIVNNGSGYACYAIDNQTNGNSYTPTLKIEGGRMQQMNAYTYAVRMFCNSTTNVNSVEICGGVIEGGYGLWLQTPNNKSNKANLVITGGTLNANDGAALYIGGTKADNSNISFDISGTATYINGTGVIIQGPLSGTYGHSSISNGNFVNVQCGANVEKFITGGIYDEVVDDIYIAEGYMCIPYGADKYTVIPIPASSLIVFHDSGNYEQSFEVPIFTRMAGADIYYNVNGGAAQKYTGPLSISEDTELEAWLQVGSTKVGESITRSYAIVEKPAGPSVDDNYYYIKNNGNGKYVNVAGRKTVTFKTKTEAEEAAGAVIRVKAAEGGAVETLRSQAIDLPGYAKRAMNYVPEMVQLIVSKLHADGGGNILGENGVDAIMAKFNDSFDYNLYLEEYNGGYRIYGRTPSMKPVVDFYAENKDNVDAKLPELETFINNAIEQVKARLNGRGESILQPFSVHAVWHEMGETLTEPVDAESTARFYEEVLASENNVWEFAYQTAMMYYEPLMASETFQGMIANIGDYKKYLDKLPNVQPNFKYYIVADGNKVDFISEGNPEINENGAIWTLEDRTNFTVKFDENDKLVDGLGTKYYTTLYTDFAYTMPENAKAYAVTNYNVKDVADLEVITGVIPAQTPVLLMTLDEGLEATLTLSTDAGTAPTTNLLKGADWVINEYEMKNEQLQGLFEFVKSNLGDTFYENYVQKFEHLMALNAGTVNNKFFFGLSDDFTSMVDNLRQLGVEANDFGEMRLGFWENYNALPANKAFLIEEPNPVFIPLWPDVNCDGIINTADVSALIEIVLDDDVYAPDWIYPYYNHSVADVNQDGIINTTDVTELVSIVLDLQ